MKLIKLSTRLDPEAHKLLKLAQHQENRHRGNGMKLVSIGKLVSAAIKNAYGSNTAKLETLRNKNRELAQEINQNNERIEMLDKLSQEVDSVIK